MSISYHRRAFLKGSATSAMLVRPPWALTENRFIQACTRCGLCVDSCPENIIKQGSGQFPEVDFKQGECTFCEDCLNACQPKALFKKEKTLPWQMKASISTDCLVTQKVVCQTCSEHCDQEAIVFKPVVGGLSSPRLKLDLCNGCGACVRPCPVDAIKMVGV